MIIRDNLTRFSVKNVKFDWTRTAMPSSLLISPEGFVLEPYKLKESCKEAPYLVLIWAFSILGTCKTYCNQISTWN